MRKAAVTRCLSALAVLVTDWNGEDYAEPAAYSEVRAPLMSVSSVRFSPPVNASTRPGSPVSAGYSATARPNAHDHSDVYPAPKSTLGTAPLVATVPIPLSAPPPPRSEAPTTSAQRLCRPPPRLSHAARRSASSALTTTVVYDPATGQEITCIQRFSPHMDGSGKQPPPRRASTYEALRVRDNGPGHPREHLTAI